MSVFEGRHHSSTVETLINDVIVNKTRPINLNPDYQRDIVWSEDKKSKFIDSILIGIIPNAVLFNYKPDERTCIDGKQRITSIVEYYNNKFPLILENDDYAEEHIYYSKLPNNMKENKEVSRIMTGDEKQKFLERHISIVSYQNLTYENEREIFNRIQNGVALTEGEKLFSLFKKEKNTQIYKKFCDKHKDSFSINVRYSHAIDITEIIYMFKYDTLKRPTKKQREKLLRYLDKIKLDNHLKKTENIYNLVPLVEDYKFKKNIRFALIMLLHREYNKPILSNKDVKEIKKILSEFEEIYLDDEDYFNNNNNQTYAKIEEVFNDITEDIYERLSDNVDYDENLGCDENYSDDLDSDNETPKKVVVKKKKSNNSKKNES